MGEPGHAASIARYTFRPTPQGERSETSAVAESVMVGMSGGVDSAVSALVLLERGFDVAGLFMKNWDEDDGTEYCTAEADYADAAKVCDRLGIELHTANFAAEYWDNVFEAFLADYRAARTPNPDVLCNREIKFKQFADYAALLGFEHIATGHYARRTLPDQPFRLFKGRDRGKDQTYFLQAVPKEQLAACLFPVGHLTKPEVREQARKAGFHVHDKKDSTGICFIGERRFADFLARYIDDEPGPLVDADGTVLGEHRGLAFYTLGQRQGLGVGGLPDRPEAPWYVVAKDVRRNSLVVSQCEADLTTRTLRATQLNWIAAPRDGRCAAKVRYRQPDQACEVGLHGDCAEVAFDAPQRAVTPGQYVAFYDGDECLGGGRIEATW